MSSRILRSLPVLSILLKWALAIPFSALAEEDEGPDQPIGSASFWYKMVIAAVLIVLGGVFAGLTLGLMGLDELHLRVLATSSDEEQERTNARKGVCHEHLMFTGERG